MVNKFTMQQIHEHYCKEHQYFEQEQKDKVTLSFSGWNGDRNPTFKVVNCNLKPTGITSIWSYDKTDCSKFSKQLKINKRINPLTIVDADVAKLFRDKTGLKLYGYDISSINIGKDKLTIIISDKSLLYKNSFTIARV